MMSPEQAAEPAGRSLFSLQRRERLMEELRAHGSITVRGLAAELGVSELTIRRDVNLLAEEGLVSRVHGGATLPSPLDRSASKARQYLSHRYSIGMVVPSLDYYWPQVISGARAEAEDLQARIVVRGSSYDAADNRRQVQALLDNMTDSSSPTSSHVVRGWRQALAALRIPLEESVNADSAAVAAGNRAAHFDRVLEGGPRTPAEAGGQAVPAAGMSPAT